MSNPTTPFGWQMPTATDLVTDLPADFEVFGQAVATSMGDLLGGTTGQILSKTTNTDMDFTWVSANPGDITGVTAGTGISGGGTSGDVTITNSMATAIDAKGDLIVGTGADTFSKLTAGINGYALVADSAEATGLKWAAPASGGMTLINSGGTTLSGSSIQVASIPSTYNYLYCEIVGFRPATNATDIRMTFNNDSNVKYGWSGGSTFNQPSTKLTDGGASSSSSNALISFTIPAYTNTTTWKFAWAQALAPTSANTANFFLTNYMSLYNGTSAISSIELVPSAGNFTSGTFYVWGVK
jgi:hypothetical protein